MVQNFYSLGNRIKRFISKGVAIFNGHPNMPDAGAKYPDKGEKQGLIVELQTRDNGIYCEARVQQRRRTDPARKAAPNFSSAAAGLPTKCPPKRTANGYSAPMP